MKSLAPTFKISADQDIGEVQFACTGLWDMDTMVEFQRELVAASKPMFERGQKMRSLADLRGFSAQTKEVSDAIRIVVVEAIKLGTERTAIIVDSTLVGMQYRRLNEGLPLEIFDNRMDAIAWLRAKD